VRGRSGQVLGDACPSLCESECVEPESLIKHAEALGLDAVQFKECLGTGKHAAQIKAAMAEGQKAGITGTPGFLLGFVEADGKVKATKRISGAVPYANFKAAIDEMLSSKR